MLIENEIELWRDIPGYEGYYQASSFGRIRGVDRTVKTFGGGNVLLKSKIIKFKKNNHPYFSIKLHKDGIGKLRSVHRFIAETWIPNPENKPQVNHLDGNKKNNRVDNLAWATRSENAKHAVLFGLMKPLKGEDVNFSKLIESDVLSIVAEYNEGKITTESLGKKYNVDRKTISLIITGKNWKHITGIDANKNLTAKGENHPYTTLKDADVLDIKNSFCEGNVTAKSLALKYDVKLNLIYNIVNGVTWKHVGSDIDMSGKSFLDEKIKVNKEVEAKIINMYYEEKKSQKAIANVFNIHSSSVFNVIKRYRLENKVAA